jgi:hypothetical protein
LRIYGGAFPRFQKESDVFGYSAAGTAHSTHRVPKPENVRIQGDERIMTSMVEVQQTGW